MKKPLFLLVFISLLSMADSMGQVWRIRRWEAMAGLGTANQFGDIGGYSHGENLLGIKDIRFLQTRPAFHLGARYKIVERVATKINLSYAFLSGNDNRGSNVGRDYSFTTGLFEFSFQGEYAFWREEYARSYLMMKGRGVTDFSSSFSAYAFAGIGMAVFKPWQNDKLIDRAGEIQNSSALVFPAGVALKYGLSPKASLTLEVGGRFTTSDVIDGFPSEYSRANDVYYFGVVSYVWKFQTSRKGWPMLREVYSGW